MRFLEMETNSTKIVARMLKLAHAFFNSDYLV